MAKNGGQERQRFWRNLIGRQPASGLSIARFCKQAGVSANSFFVWKRRLRSQAAAVENGKTAPSTRRIRQGDCRGRRRAGKVVHSGAAHRGSGRPQPLERDRSGMAHRPRATGAVGIRC